MLPRPHLQTISFCLFRKPTGTRGRAYDMDKENPQVIVFLKSLVNPGVPYLKDCATRGL